MKIPCLAKTVFGPVWTSPSAPPSFTVDLAQLPDRRARPRGSTPGHDCVRVVEMEHVPPIPVEPVATHGTVTGNGAFWTVAGWFSAVPLSRSVIRTVEVACTSPV